ncbi:MAG: NERD domain-containing protein [Firmicutes bacterium]|nr:NERD domain-containing protein [Bacillota bacterium]
MRKEKLLKPFDIIVYFNIFMFVAVSTNLFHINLLLGIITLSLSVFNAIFIIQTVILRNKYNKEFLRKIEIEIKAEEITVKSESSPNTYFNAKQVLLENRIEVELREKLPDIRIIKNAYIPKVDGTFSEIDIIAINKTGIYVIEAKNVTGQIVGRWKEPNLILKHPGGNEYPFPNPIDQNTMHFKYLKNLLGMSNNYFRSIIVFGDTAFFDCYKDVPYYAEVCRLDKLTKSMDRLARKFPIEMSDSLITSTYEGLIEFTKKTVEREKEHISRIDKFKKTL